MVDPDFFFSQKVLKLGAGEEPSKLSEMENLVNVDSKKSLAVETKRMVGSAMVALSGSEMKRRSSPLSLIGCCPSCGVDLSGFVMDAKASSSGNEGSWALVVMRGFGEDEGDSTRVKVSGAGRIKGDSDGQLEPVQISNLNFLDGWYKKWDGKEIMGLGPSFGREPTSSINSFSGRGDGPGCNQGQLKPVLCSDPNGTVKKRVGKKGWGFGLSMGRESNVPVKRVSGQGTEPSHSQGFKASKKPIADS